ncbi:helix-turn-helix domain-containing protein [Aureimonas pseudogalii]|uniref:Helix-turn-helix domain-containing protein n=1 Tax=Aureimonas pseudogalii TaxID=1744844 RepID=A0A7W6H4X8_9HYPH|nr:helix-turn-helix domain-containing protein [Aureimonas pseudogalii]MBB3998626.1 hypothetical protein [Aureimonas pseudogalii]
MTGFNKNAWYRQIVKAVSPRAFAVGFVLVETFLFRGNEECWSSQDTIGRLANASPRTVRDALRELEDAGFLTHRRGGKGHANRYIPHFVDRQDLADQNSGENAFDRQDLAYDDRQNPAAERAVHRAVGGPAFAGPADTLPGALVCGGLSPPSSPVGVVGESPTNEPVNPSSRVEPEPIDESDRVDVLYARLEKIADANFGYLPVDCSSDLVQFYERVDGWRSLDLDVIEDDLLEFESVTDPKERHDRQIKALEIVVQREDDPELPLDLLRFAARNQDPSPTELDRLVSLHRLWRSGDYREDENGREIVEKPRHAADRPEPASSTRRMAS